MPEVAPSGERKQRNFPGQSDSRQLDLGSEQRSRPSGRFYQFGYAINISRATHCVDITIGNHLPNHHVRVSSGHRPFVGVKSDRLVGDLGGCASVYIMQLKLVSTEKCWFQQLDPTIPTIPTVSRGRAVGVSGRHPGREEGNSA